MAWFYSVGIIYLGLISVLFCDENIKVNNLTDNNSNVIPCTQYEFCEKYPLIEHERKKWERKPIRLTELIESVPSIFQLLPVNSSNVQCAHQSRLILKGADNLEIWALNFLDSWGKYPSGFLSGNGNQFGDFDQCLAINGEVTSKYCLVTLNVRLPKQLHLIDQLVHSHYAMVASFSDPSHRLPKFSLFQWGFCIPSVCTATDLQTTLQPVLTSQNIIKVRASVTEDLCYTTNDILPGSQQSKIFVMLFFVGLVLLCISGTISDIWTTKTHTKLLRGKISAAIEVFSIHANYKTLVDINVSSGDISSLHGIRFLNALALLLSHKHAALLFTPYMNRTSMAKIIGRAWATTGRTAIIYTDSFILLSGLLTTVGLLKELNRKKKINIVSNIISRLIRLTPNLLVTIIFCTFVMPRLSSGPQWNLVVTKHAYLCDMYWWRNILYIHNLFGFEEMCLTHTHQLGIDMQLFLVSPLLVYCLWKWKKFGFIFLIFISLLSTVLRFIVTFNRKLSTIVYFGVPVSRLFATANFSYILPTHRLTVYCIGIATGFYLHSNRNPITLNKFQIYIGWTIGLSCGLLAMCGPYHMGRIGYVYSAFEAAVYSALSPIIWSFFICWLIFSSVNGVGGWIGQFLEWKGFIIFTRLAYAIYLTQFPIFFYNVGIKRTAEYYSVFQMFDLMEFGVVILISAILTIMVDLPCQKIKKLLSTNVQDKTDGTVDCMTQKRISYNLVVSGKNNLENEVDKIRLNG